jgi:hypothetical protein
MLIFIRVSKYYEAKQDQLKRHCIFGESFRHKCLIYKSQSFEDGEYSALFLVFSTPPVFSNFPNFT